MPQPSVSATQLIDRWRSGDQDALHALIPLVYKDCEGRPTAVCGRSVLITLCKVRSWFTRSISALQLIAPD